MQALALHSWSHSKFDVVWKPNEERNGRDLTDSLQTHYSSPKEAMHKVACKHKGLTNLWSLQQVIDISEKDEVGTSSAMNGFAHNGLWKAAETLGP